MKKSGLSVIIAAFMLLIITETALSQRTTTTTKASPTSVSYSVQYIDSVRLLALSKVPTDYTVPSFTLLQKAIIYSGSDTAFSSVTKLVEALESLQASTMPYSIVMNINGDPSTQMAFNWFTNYGVTGGKVQIVRGIAKTGSQFNKPLMTVNAKVDQVNDLNYSLPRNNLVQLAGIPDSMKRSYMSNKVLVEGLKPNTTYSFRVGKEGSWSEAGRFKTAGDGNQKFSFIYTTDPQANSDANFEISQKTTHAAFKMFPNVGFWMNCGDLIESAGSFNSEWEWEQAFLTQNDLFLNYPYAPVLGNHDKSANRNFTSHFNTDSTDFDYTFSTSPGSVYSFVYGNALFLAMSFEDYNKPGYLEALAGWIREEVESNPVVKWKIAFYHKNIYTGSTGHHASSDSKIVRDRIAPLFDSLGIHLAIQGHDHIYEVIGPVRDKKLVPGSVKNMTSVPVHERENVTGKSGGVFDVSEGTLYFLNNSAGRKKYQPMTKIGMDTLGVRLGVENYFGLFTGRFGQTGRPTFSKIDVSRDTVTISTYEISDEGVATLFDKIKITTDR